MPPPRRMSDAGRVRQTRGMTVQPPFDGAEFTGDSFRGAVLRDCDLTDLRIVDCKLTGIYVSGYDGPIVVNDVDVTEFVDGELDRLHPERVRARAVRAGSVEDFRTMWRTVTALWSSTPP